MANSWKPPVEEGVLASPAAHPRRRAGANAAIVLLSLVAGAPLAACEDEKEPFAENESTRDHEDDHEHSDDEPADDEPADDEPSDAKDAGAGDDEPADEPADDKPGDDKPGDDKPADDKPAEPKPADDKPAEPKPTEPKPAEPAKKPIYAYIHEVTDTGTYVTLTNSIDFKSDSPELALSKAREFEGGVQAVSGYLLEQTEGSSEVKQWKITDDLKWQEGPIANFSQYPLPEGANLFFNFQADDRTMYMPFEINKRIVWDPIDMKLSKVVETSKLPLVVDGLMAAPAGNRSGIRYENSIKAPYFYLDEDYIEFAPKTTLAVYDRKTHEETGLIDLPCPGLAVATQDEEGNTYYSTWDFSPLQALYNQGPKPCVARLKPDDEVDEAFTTDMTELTEGRYGANFYYVRDGWGVMDVLHHETLDLDFEASTIPTDAVAEVWDRAHWKIWLIDLKNETARPLEELGEDINLSFWHMTRIEDRVFLRLNTEEETTKIYELSKTGVPTLWDHVEDGSGEWQRVR